MTFELNFYVLPTEVAISIFFFSFCFGVYFDISFSSCQDQECQLEKVNCTSLCQARISVTAPKMGFVIAFIKTLLLRCKVEKETLIPKRFTT
jgi:hypothetical protein